MARGHNIITFTPNGGTAVMVKLDSAYQRTCGLKPDVNHATISTTEFAKLGDDVLTAGRLAFWYTYNPLGEAALGDATAGKPDFTISDVAIVEIDVPTNAVAQISGKGAGIAPFEYHVFFADSRRKYVFPHGGLLRVGLLNAGPNPTSTVTPGDGYSDDDDDDSDDVEDSTPQQSQAPEKTMRELIQLCMKSMGMNSDDAPAIDGNIQPPRDLKWFGNHAPSELEKLLGPAGCVFVPKLDGSCKIERLGSGTTPTINADAACPVFTYPNADARPINVILSSAPTAVIETMTLDGPSKDTWQFCAHDKEDKLLTIDMKGWTQLAKDVGAKANTLSYFFDYASVDDAYTQLNADNGAGLKMVQRVAAAAYKTIQLSPTKYNPTTQPVLSKVTEKDGTQTNIKVHAKIARQRADGTWENTQDLIEVPVVCLSESGNVLHVSERLAQVTHQTRQAGADYQALSMGDFNVRFSVEQQEKAPDGSMRPKYFHTGFRREKTGQLVELDDDDVQLLIDGGGDQEQTFIIKNPSLELFVVDGVQIHRTQLVERARAIAANFVRNAYTPIRVLLAKGFQPGELSGQCSHAEHDQASLITRFTIGAYYNPLGALNARRLVAHETGEYPHQDKKEASRQKQGAAGSTQPARPIYPVQAPQPAGTNTAVVINDFLGAGCYKGNYWSSSTPIDTTQAVLEFDISQGSSQPCVIVNTLEHDRSTHVIPKGKVLAGAVAAAPQKDGTPTFLVDYDPDSIRNLRYNRDTHTFQKLRTHDEDHVNTGIDWEDVVTFTNPCSS